MPARVCSPSPSGTASSPRCCGIPHIVVAVNKMDLVDYSEDVYQRIVREYTDFAEKLDVKDLTFIPISALKGDNVVERATTPRGTTAPPCCTTWRR
jgi:sulfate adenylyltransferase subunit 1 (EFTu-like GTPase family)